MTSRGWTRTIERYAAATGLALTGLVIILLFQYLRGVPDGLVFGAIVAISARFFGTGPGLMASGLSIVAIDLTILPPTAGSSSRIRKSWPISRCSLSSCS